jgi:hypothetical protein
MFYKPIALITRQRLFLRTRPSPSNWDIIAWWESRRVPYNLIVGTAGITSAIIMLGTGYITEHLIGEAIGVPGSPFFAMLAVVAYGMIANICFTGGWALEIISRRVWGARAEAFGEIAFTWGTLCSVLLTLVPAALTMAVGTYSVLAHGWKN